MDTRSKIAGIIGEKRVRNIGRSIGWAGLVRIIAVLLAGWLAEQDGCMEEHLSAGDWVPTEEGSHSEVQEGTGGDQVVRSTDPLHLADEALQHRYTNKA